MQERDRSRRRSLQTLLGELGTVLPYTRANGRLPAPGWPIKLTDPELAAVCAARADMWFTSDGSLYAGVDAIHAAATIERIHDLAQAKR